MKKGYTFLAFLLAFSCAYCYGERISVGEAKNIATDFFLEKAGESGRITPSSNTLKLAWISGAEKENADGSLYVFNRGLNEGYVVIAGDDIVSKQVLGFSDTGTFDSSAIPENLRYWLEEYQRQIEYMQENGVVATEVETETSVTSVAPLLGDIAWNQSSPYNLLCPTLPDGKKAVSGCVATAMAQIMYYWQYPDKGVGSHSYDWTYNGVTTTLSADFSQSQYQWDLMTPVYNSNSSEESKNAVALLMSDVGISVDMAYGKESAASVVKVPIALTEYFDYDKAINMCVRNQYYSDEWEQMLRTELDEGRPVYYRGRNESSGHAFVCDGYDSDGYYHMNWGWGGSSNGYFLLTALYPGMQGIGSSDGGYNYEQYMVIGIQPNQGGVKPETGYVALTEWEVTNGTCDVGGIINISMTGIWNHYTDTLGFDFVLNLYDGDVLKATKLIVRRAVTPPNMGLGGTTQKFTIPSDLADGTYRIYPQYKFISESEESYRNMRVGKNVPSYIIVEITDGKVNATLQEVGHWNLRSTSLKTDTYVVANRAFRAYASVTNDGDVEYYDKLSLEVVSSGSTVGESAVFMALIKPGETISFEYDVPAVSTAGYYTLVLKENDGAVVGRSGFYAWAAESNPKLAIKEALAAGADEMTADNVWATATLVNNGGYYNGDIEVMIYGDNNIYLCLKQYVTLMQGEEKKITFKGTFEDGVVGKTYNMSLRNYANTSKYQVWGSAVTFTLVGNSSAVDRVGSDSFRLYPNPAESAVTVSGDKAIDSVEIYSLSGVMAMKEGTGKRESVILDVSGLSGGLYLVKVMTADGEAKILKLNKK